MGEIEELASLTHREPELLYELVNCLSHAISTFFSKRGGPIHERSGFVELMNHFSGWAHLLFEVERCDANVEQDSNRISSVLLDILKSACLCCEIEFGDLDNPPPGFSLNDELEGPSLFHWTNHPFPRHGAKRSRMLRSVPAAIVG